MDVNVFLGGERREVEGIDIDIVGEKLMPVHGSTKVSER